METEQKQVSTVIRFGKENIHQDSIQTFLNDCIKQENEKTDK